MVRICAFPNCDNRMSRHTPRSFHRLPLWNRDTLKLWLAVLQMDANTPVGTLRVADHRVCSDHFEREDYCQANRRRNPTPKHFFLKKNAVPRPAAHTVETQREDAADPAGHTSCWEMDYLVDIGYGTPSAASPLSPESSSGSASGSSNGETPGGWAEKKWLVNESNLMELFKTCRRCGCCIDEKKITTNSSQIKIQWTCVNGHSEQWASCPDEKGTAENNVPTCAASLFTGAAEKESLAPDRFTCRPASESGCDGQQSASRLEADGTVHWISGGEPLFHAADKTP